MLSFHYDVYILYLLSVSFFPTAFVPTTSEFGGAVVSALDF